MRSPTFYILALSIASVSASACSDDDTGTDNSSSSASCQPPASEFDSTVLPIIERKCHKCHGAQTDFGAPFSLDSYDALTHGSEGTRIVDLMVPALTEFAMPPAGNPQLTEAELDTLLGWASCGTAEADPSRGLVASRPVWQSPPEPSAGLRRLDLVASEHLVSQGAEIYENFYFSNLVDHDQFIRRLDVVIDESRVVHHVTAHYKGSNSYLYAWAPGTGAVEFPEGGLRIRPSDEFRIEVHYNNGANLENIRDSSGVAFYVAEVGGTEYAMADPANFTISVPPKSVQTVTTECVPTHDFRIVASMPHMHEIGKSFSYELIRPDGASEPIITLDNWSFELQYFYDTPVTVNAGDRLKLTCTYENPTEKTVVGGPKTGDEMCYNFMYITPPEASADCSLSH